jgi:hypothetical protein
VREVKLSLTPARPELGHFTAREERLRACVSRLDRPALDLDRLIPRAGEARPAADRVEAAGELGVAPRSTGPANSTQPQKPPVSPAQSVRLLQLNESPICHMSWLAPPPYAPADEASAAAETSAATITNNVALLSPFSTVIPLALCRTLKQSGSKGERHLKARAHCETSS